MIKRTLGLWLAIHLFALMFLLVGASSWLLLSNRYSAERLERVKAIFKDPVSSGEGGAVVSVAAVVAEEDQSTQSPKQVSQLTRERRLQELRRIKKYIENQTRVLDEQKKQLAKAQKALDEREVALTQQANDKGLAKAIELYEGLPPKQVKDIFMNMMREADGLDRVAEYLGTMDARKATAVLEQFKDPMNELPEAKRLMERLRAGTETKEPTG